MTLTFVLPECIAIRTWEERAAAGTIQRKYQKYGWTKAHAYLVLMGGLALYDKDEHFRGYLQDSESFQQADYALAREIEQVLTGKQQNHHGPPSSHEEILLEENCVQHRAIQLGNMQVSNNHLASFASPLPEISASDYPCQRNEELQAALITSVHEAEEDTCVKPKPAFLEPYSCLLEYVLARGLVALQECEIQDNLSHGDFFAKLSALLSTGWFMIQSVARAKQGLAISEVEAVTLTFTVHSIAIYLFSWNKPQRIRYPVRVTWEPTPPKTAPPTTTRQYLLKVVPKLWMELRDRIVADIDGVFGNTNDARTGCCQRIWMGLMWGWYPFWFLAFQAWHLVYKNDFIRPTRGTKNVTIFHNVIPELRVTILRLLGLGMFAAAIVFVDIHVMLGSGISDPQTSSTPPIRIVWLVASFGKWTLFAVILIQLVFLSLLKSLHQKTLAAAILFNLGMAYYMFSRLIQITLAIFIPLKYGLAESGYRDVDWLHFIPHIG
ncbi:hypothetical protein V5O48_014943 [Marasmius crinis-equi]|uniref:Uncharacterized protein n=1 Tax=Marasmius crinis-equi TaxID=585013 RepID=A0ABR3EVV8_9AGAR